MYRKNGMSFNKKIFSKAVFLLLAIAGLAKVIAAVIFTPDTQPIGYIGQPAVTNNKVTSGNERLYAIDYSSMDWSGNLHSYALNNTGAISDLDDWDGGAAEQINAQNPDTGRVIVTMNGSSKIPFRWNSLSASQQTDLGSSAVLDYIRGVQTNEVPNGVFRARNSVLGDIIHSTPVYWDDGTNQTVFVGANDGMLHAINAATGKERFAYIPSILIPKLRALTDASYAHQYFVDGRMDIHKFGVDTILAGALGAGGKGLFGLNVTNAAESSETDAGLKLWEVTNATSGFANLGYTYGAPTLLTLPSGTAALAVGNGYNSSVGTASLFLIDAITGALIQEIDAGSGSTSSPNGLSSPSFWDIDGDGKKDVAYAGDIDGNLWKFNLAAPYSVTKLYTTNPAQAISMAPGVKRHPLGGRMVTFVTGRMLTDVDAADTAPHYAYGIWDGASGVTATKNDLLSQTLTETNYTGATPSIRVRTASSNYPDWDIHKGWMTALPVGGERVVGDGAYVADSAFMFMSTNPTISPTATPPGENWWMQLNPLTGGDNGTILLDLNKDGAFTAVDQVTGPLSPVGRNMGGGVRSQLIALSANGFDVYQANYDKNGAPPPITEGDDRGVAGGHFDEDIYYGSSITTPDKHDKYTSKMHNHEYDDIYNVTGVNMLDASNTGFDLANAIPLAMTAFKVLAQNQYLSPAVKIHIHGSPSYVYNVDQGYTPIKNFITSATLDVAQVPTYTRANINSFAINMPVDAFTPKDWWGGVLGLPADVRVGLHPTQTGCVKTSKNATDGNMYQPVNPPSSVTDSGNGTLGYSAGTTGLTATGVRHNGALVIQIIKEGTPQNAIEISVPGHPEYGWRVKSANYSTYVLAEYTTFWHEKLIGKCYGETGWSKVAATDTRTCGARNTTTTRQCATEKSSAAGFDPHIGGFGSGDTTTTTGNTTTSTVTNADGSVTITVVVTNPDGTKTTTVTIVTPGIETGGVVNIDGGINRTGIDTHIKSKVIGRINWRELQP